MAILDWNENITSITYTEDARIPRRKTEKKTSKTKNWTLLCKSFEQSSGYFIRESINICTVSFEFCIHLLCSRR